MSRSLLSMIDSRVRVHCLQKFHTVLTFETHTQCTSIDTVENETTNITRHLKLR